MQGLLQVDHNLAAVGKHQSDHSADPLVVDVDIGNLVDPVATRLDALEHGLSPVHEFRVRHYNFAMLHICRILVSGLVLAGGAVSLMGCGQKGLLFLPTEPAAAHRATLPQTLRSSIGFAPPPATTAASAPAAPTATLPAQ